MEEQILKIINNPQNCPEMAAKEIAKHFEKFMEWVRMNCEPSMSNKTWVIFNDEIKIIADLPIKELYSYWLNNIDNK